MYYTGTDLDDDDYICAENLHAEKDFFGDSKDYDLISANAPKLSDWKENNAHVSVGFNQSTKEMHDQLKKLSHFTNKLKHARGSEIVPFEDVVNIQYGPDS